MNLVENLRIKNGEWRFELYTLSYLVERSAVQKTKCTTHLICMYMYNLREGASTKSITWLLSKYIISNKTFS